VIVHVLWALAVCAVQLEVQRRRVRAAHEVRGPLSVAQLALGGFEPCARVDAIELELRRAALALEDLGGARRARAREVVDLAQLVGEAAPAWRALAAAGGASLSVEPSCAAVAGDRLRLAQAAANLVANAIEHGGPDVRVRATAAAGRVSLEVSDDGPGLPAPLPRLLTAARGRRSRRGHGLAIAAAIAERHGGRLVALPAVRGTRLALDLPAHGAP